jgi:DNA-binding beta-propeller fold protein YncE
MDRAGRGVKRAHVEIGGCVANVEVTTGEGVTMQLNLPVDATVFTVKMAVEHENGNAVPGMHMFLHDVTRDEELRNDETLKNLQKETGTKVELSLLMEDLPDAQQVVPILAPKADVTLEDHGTEDDVRELQDPRGVAFMHQSDWLVVAEFYAVKILDKHTGATICKFGEYGRGEGQFHGAGGVALTHDDSFVLVTDSLNHRVQVLRIVLAETGGAKLEFVRFLGGKKGRGDGQLRYPGSVALLCNEQRVHWCNSLREGKQPPLYALISERGNSRVSQFSLDGVFVRSFAGTGRDGSGDGDLFAPRDAITLLSGEVAIADRSNNRIQIFDGEGNYVRQVQTIHSDTRTHTYTQTLTIMVLCIIYLVSSVREERQTGSSTGHQA